MVGIDALKSDIVIIAKVVGKVDKALDDSKISFTEAVGLAFELPNLFKVAKSYKNVVAELKDLTVEEVAEINEHFAKEFDIANDKAEEVVEQILSLIITLTSAFLSAEGIM